MQKNTKYDIYKGKKYNENLHVTKINETEYTSNLQDFICPYSLVLFCIRSGQNNPTFYSKMKLYSCKIWEDNNNLIRHFIPCYVKMENKKGLYDLVEGKFYQNEGTGNDFTAGENV